MLNITNATTEEEFQKNYLDKMKEEENSDSQGKSEGRQYHYCFTSTQITNDMRTSSQNVVVVLEVRYKPNTIVTTVNISCFNHILVIIRN